MSSSKQELKTDLQLLLECLEYQKGDQGAMKQALITLSSILQSSDEGQDIFREVGGLQTVLTLATSTRFGEVKDAGLYCLGSAVERNTYSQKLLSTASVFNFLHHLLSATINHSVRRKQTASYLTLCVVSNNSYGQNLARESSCLHDVLCLIRTTLPKNSKQLQLDLMNGQESVNIELWAALVSTACACVNNPINDENQRLCASLLPFLLSLLSTQTDERIVKPILSLVGLTVNGNVMNQDRVRKCGGFEILVRQLEGLLSLDSGERPGVLSQLLTTLDACIADNEMSCKRFGQLGGLKVVMRLFTEMLMTDSDRIQATLTLAHAVEACSDNEVYIQDGGAMTVLIQQLTETTDEELSKTIKYLLHMCVSTDKTGNVETEEGQMSSTELLFSKMEAMKRHSDLAMLRKINELDSKLRSMEHHRTASSSVVEEEVEVQGRNSQRKRPLSDGEGSRVSAVTQSVCSGHSTTHNDCPVTPREQTLMQQLIKERVDREKLEKLNFMLQEKICYTNTSQPLPQAPTMGRPLYTTSTHCVSGANQNNNTTTCESTHNIVSEPRNSNENKAYTHQHDYNGYTEKHVHDFRQRALTPERQAVSPLQQGPYALGTTLPSVSKTELRHCNNLNSELEEDKSYSTKQRDNVSTAKDAVFGTTSVLKQASDQIISGSSGYQAVRSNCIQATPSDQIYNNDDQLTAVPLDLSRSRNDVTVKPEGNASKQTVWCTEISNQPNRTDTQLHQRQDNQESNSRMKNDYCGNTTIVQSNKLVSSKSSGIHQSRHAEIQCGTPIVVAESRNKSNNDDNLRKQFQRNNPDTVLKTPFVVIGDYPAFESVKPGEKLAPQKSTVVNEKHENPCTDTDAVTHTKNSEYFSNESEGFVVNNTSSIQYSTEDSLTKSVIKNNANSSSQKSGEVFVKPTAPPPRSKVRLTPMKAVRCLIPRPNEPHKDGGATYQDYNNSAYESDSDASIVSDFDLELIKNTKTAQQRQRNTNTKPQNKPDSNNFNIVCAAAKDQLSFQERRFSSPNTRFSRHQSSAQNPSPKSDQAAVNEAFGKASQVIKSQNNVWRLDRKVGGRERNAADSWTTNVTNLCSPEHQAPIIPPRPAFSDCGMRRHFLNNSPCSSRSQAMRRRSLDDSGFQSPSANMLERITEETSPVDSNVEGLRSSSDVSEEEEMVPNISAAVLRSRQPTQNNTKSRMCPGCTGVDDTDHPHITLLNSRNFNIAVETNPNTCDLHRRLRQIEREHIHRMNIALNRRPATQAARLALRGQRKHTRHVSKESVYEYDTTQVSDVSDEESALQYQVMRPRECVRPQCKYTVQEEAYIRQGVARFGRNWVKILNTYSFHPGRVPSDLKYKYRRMMDGSKDKCTNSRPSSKPVSRASHATKKFSMCEIRRLKRGVQRFGHRWTTILSAFTFSKGRTANELRHKWGSSFGK